MRRILLLILSVIMILIIAMSACSTPNNEDTTDQVKEEEQEAQPTEDPQIALDNEQTLEYLSLLDLDENCSYQLGGTFPSGLEDKNMYLVSVSNITEEKFTDIQDALASNGFNVVSDISINEEAKTRSYPYSNNENLYIEIVYSYGSEYFDVTFTPFT